MNKVATKVELRFAFRESQALTDSVCARLARLAENRLDAEGRLLVTADESRSQSQNLESARERVAELVRAALVVPKRRRATKPSKASKRRRLDDKKRDSNKKRSRSSREWG